MNIRKALVLYKKTAYSVYKGEKIISTGSGKSALLRAEHRQLKKAHEEHHRTYEYVTQVLNEFNISYKSYYRGGRISFDSYDLVLTIGGDGTFLKASGYISDQLLIGVNSATSYSVGRLCSADIHNFKNVLKSVIDGQHKIENLQRLDLKTSDSPVSRQVLNDILITHTNPAMLSRYSIVIGARREEQRSSGIWISTPVGSTGAIGSAGGRVLSPYAKKFQYLPRELYQGLGNKYKLRGGVLSGRQSMRVVSLMPKGKIYIDGGHNFIDFPYGKEIRIKLSKKPIRTLKI